MSYVPDDFTLLGFYIDNKLAKLETNLDRIDAKVCNLIIKWHHYNLSVHGRITITKSVLISQYTYVITILDLTDEDRLDKIQCIINNYIAFNRYEMTSKCKSWISNDMLYGDPKDGGFNMIKIKEFFLSI